MTEEIQQSPDQGQSPNIIDNLMSMHMHEREEMFKIFTENRELFNKLVPDTRFFDIVTDPASEIDHPLARHYQHWLRVQATGK